MGNKIMLKLSTNELKTIKDSYNKLINCVPKIFNAGLKQVPMIHGVYIIHRINGTVLHVGRTYRAKKGLKQRLNNHLKGVSSFMKRYNKISVNSLKKCYFRFIPVKNDRMRALLELYAAAMLCPKYLGLHKAKDEEINS